MMGKGRGTNYWLGGGFLFDCWVFLVWYFFFPRRKIGPLAACGKYFPIPFLQKGSPSTPGVPSGGRETPCGPGWRGLNLNSFI